ncbi:excalibur calcium-binding domain-containing protein [Streptomyces sp. LRE541]|uniref:excalibur calcium-binding domain-containing protein n=1 Tax=Streptomyces sp. LRE541 TaxID=2931983 RepID=UPI00200EA63F|nr:excalibur calcium-binding domain-containing protein [Streptomyces sp. LRE541]UPZ27596.1 excalibur calcium-binding domain-containing protein [Streptomyces sp. LRE541]
MAYPYTPPPPPMPPSRTAPKWARKRFVLPALGLAFFIGIGAGAGSPDPEADTKAAASKTRPTATATVTATATETAKAKPAPTVTATKTKTVKVKVTVTAKAPAVDNGTNGGSGDDSNGGSVYYQNCDAARAAGAAPVHRGDPGYASHLDRDGDGTGCDT